MRIVAWDLDGTLIDSAGDIAAAVDRALVARGLPALGEARVRGFIGEGARRLLDQCASAAGGVADDAMLTAFLEDYARHLTVRTRVWPAALPALLARIDAPMAIVTNKPERLALRCVHALGLERYFSVVLGADTLPTRKPDPAPLREAAARLAARDGVMVGDGPADVGAAVAAGWPMIGVGWDVPPPVGATVSVRTLDALEGALRAYDVPFRD